MYSNGYDIYNRPSEVWLKDAIPAEDCFVTRFSGLAKELNISRPTLDKLIKQHEQN